MVKNKITVALVGNPNSGKTTIFNHLTGLKQHVGNYPGVTVEKKEGLCFYQDYQITFVDLPGTYSLSAHSLDELITREFILNQKPDVVVNIVDVSNLERSLYLATQLFEFDLKLVLAFNMYDFIQAQAVEIDKPRLEELFLSPIVFTVGHKKKGIDELLKQIVKVFKQPLSESGALGISYGPEIQQEIEKIEAIISHDLELTRKYPLRWLAVKLLEADKQIQDLIAFSPYLDRLNHQVVESSKHLNSLFADSVETLIVDQRYGFISGVCSQTIRRQPVDIRHSISDKIDKVLLNKFFGLPILLGIVWCVFWFTFSLGTPLMDLIDKSVHQLQGFISQMLPINSVINSLFVEGIIGGVGSVIVFVPIIFLLFLAIGFLEYSGYMARAAFVMDKFMHRLGLHGRSFIPMLLGFGCNVPAIMVARTISDRKDRIVTSLIIPFISCGARLPVYALFIAAFFPQSLHVKILFSLYLLGLIIAVIVAKLLRKYVLPGDSGDFVMELPPYRMPPIKGLLIHMWERGAGYLKKAGTVIFAACVVIWALSHFSWQGNKLTQKVESSYAGKIGQVLVPVFKPLGFDDWRVSMALVSGVAAKEIVVGTLGTLFAAEENEQTSLRKHLQTAKKSDGSKLFSPLVAYAFMVFVLLYVPCIPTVVVIGTETKAWGWALFSLFFNTGVAWVIAFLIYQGGKFLGFG